jgi:hypothetical protein
MLVYQRVSDCCFLTHPKNMLVISANHPSRMVEKQYSFETTHQVVIVDGVRWLLRMFDDFSVIVVFWGKIYRILILAGDFQHFSPFRWLWMPFHNVLWMVIWSFYMMSVHWLLINFPEFRWFLISVFTQHPLDWCFQRNKYIPCNQTLQLTIHYKWRS